MVVGKEVDCTDYGCRYFRNRQKPLILIQHIGINGFAYRRTKKTEDVLLPVNQQERCLVLFLDLKLRNTYLFCGTNSILRGKSWKQRFDDRNIHIRTDALDLP